MYRRERSKRSRLTLCLRWVCLVCWRFCSGAVAGVSWMWIRTLWVRCCQDGRFCYLNSSKSCRWGDMCTIMWKRREWWGVMKCRTMKGTPLILPIYRRSREEWVVCWEEWCHHHDLSHNSILFLQRIQHLNTFTYVHCTDSFYGRVCVSAQKILDFPRYWSKPNGWFILFSRIMRSDNVDMYACLEEYEADKLSFVDNSICTDSPSSPLSPEELFSLSTAVTSTTFVSPSENLNLIIRVRDCLLANCSSALFLIINPSSSSQFNPFVPCWQEVDWNESTGVFIFRLSMIV